MIKLLSSKVGMIHSHITRENHGKTMVFRGFSMVFMQTCPNMSDDSSMSHHMRL